MRYHNFHLKAGILIMLFGLTACSKNYLDRFPLDEITSEDYWKTKGDLELYVNQFYPTAFNITGSDRYTAIFAADLQSDDMIYTQVNPRLNGTRVVPGAGGWDYSQIRGLNVFFQNYTKCQDDFSVYKQYVGEAHFFRAYFYFNLVKEYGDVPYFTRPLETNSPALYGPRVPRNEVIDSIVADLEQAIAYLPAGKQLGGTRLSREIAQLFKSRVCLYEGSWEKYHAGDPFAVANADPKKYFRLAADAALAVINSGLYSLYAVGDPNWNYFFFAQTDYASNPEVLFWKKYDLTLGIGHSRQYQVGQGLSGGVGLTKSFVESYLCTDGKPISTSSLYQGDGNLASLAANRDPRLKQTIFLHGFPIQISGTDTSKFVRPAVDKGANSSCPTGYQINKILNFDPQHHKSSGTEADGFTGWIIFRYAEVLLNYAEAKAELGTLTQADIDISIKHLRERVGMPNLDLATIVTDPGWSFPTLPPVINEIRRERRVELVGEGFRWDDIARWAAADELILQPNSTLGARFNMTDYPDLQAADFVLTNGYFDYLKPQIPEGYGFDLKRDYLSPLSTQEMTLNDKLVQNPGWK